jgi:hypothetical protein
VTACVATTYRPHAGVVYGQHPDTEEAELPCGPHTVVQVVRANLHGECSRSIPALVANPPWVACSGPSHGYAGTTPLVERPAQRTVFCTEPPLGSDKTYMTTSMWNDRNVGHCKYFWCYSVHPCLYPTPGALRSVGFRSTGLPVQADALGCSLNVRVMPGRECLSSGGMEHAELMSNM